jgi:hypothetical protein
MMTFAPYSIGCISSQTLQETDSAPALLISTPKRTSGQISGARLISLKRGGRFFGEKLRSGMSTEWVDVI